MNTNCKRWIHVTFAIGVLVLAVSASTSATAAPAARFQKFEPIASHGTQMLVNRAAPTVRSRTGEFDSWILNRRGSLSFILRALATTPLKSMLPVGVVVDDGVPF
jgi:hypothetical protein